MSEEKSIDESLYSRQLYVLGHEAMRKMQSSNILISGMGGLGVEIAKNVILAGVKSVTIQDTELVSHYDLASQYFLSENDLGKNRALQTLSSLAVLNSYVPVDCIIQKLTVQQLKNFQVVVLTDSSYDEQEEFGEFCHQNSIRFIVAESKGVFGKIFCDFGDSFHVNDINGEASKKAMISYISNDKEGIVTTFDDQRHDLEDDAIVRFSDVKGMNELNDKEFRIKVLSPYSFTIGDTSHLNKYVNGGLITEVKKTKTIDFKSIRSAALSPDYLITDYTKFDDNDTLHIAFQALTEFKRKQSRLPKPWDDIDALLFLNITKELNSKLAKPFENLNEDLIRLFANCCLGQLCPLNSVIGGFTAQEVMKACSGKFHPLVQYLYFDCREVLPENKIQIEKLDESSRYVSQIAVFGEEFQSRLERTKCFLVGSGALGCEYLKNFAMIGLACSKDGQLVVTDMDTIEKSNLNRQFLFRNYDVQKPKAEVASKAAKLMNPNLNVEPHLNRVAKETEKVYSDKFFESLDVVCNALDNVAARLYIDSRCIESKKSLIESGTLGTNGNVQIVLPFLTEAYSSSSDPPDKSIPLCTLKIFPNSIEHTLNWARDKFQGLFSNSVVSTQNYIKDVQKFQSHIAKLPPHQRLEELEHVEKLLISEKCITFDDCVHWALKSFQDNFHHQISQLIFNFPPDHKTNLGLPFWSGPKRCPHPLIFNPNIKLHFDYIFSAANLKAYVHGIEQQLDATLVSDSLARIDFNRENEQFKAGAVRIKIDEKDDEIVEDEDEEEQKINQLNETLMQKHNELSKDAKLFPIEFEKDDDTNLHMDFITSCSNLRAENYDILPADKHHSKLIAGKIIPAIATTTALIVGLDCIELYKLIQGHKEIKYFKNSFVNLALPFMSFSEPMPVKTNKLNSKEWSLWDRIEVKGDITIREFLENFKKEHQLKISMICQEYTIIYSEYAPPEKTRERLDKKLTEVLETIRNEKLEDHKKSITLTVSCYDTDDNDVDIPLVRYTF